ncbi:site-specific DNA-methyltransferase [Streptococcus suis]
MEVLKVLQESYLGKIDMIYIDPPYNTGKDFVYSDKFQMSEEELADEMDLRDEDGLQRVGLTKNEKSSARYHSDWLNMMYPRLVLARNLLKDSGVIFISIDDNEQANLKAICDEIFGEENFVALLPIINNLKGNNDQFGFAGTHEYCFVFCKNVQNTKIYELYMESDELLEWTEDEYGLYKKGANLKATGINAPREKRPNLFFPIYISKDKNISLDPLEDSVEVLPITDGKEMSWRWSKEKFINDKHNIIVVGEVDNYSIYKKQRNNSDELPTKKPKTSFTRPEYSSSNGSAMMKKLFSDKVFDFPKAMKLILDFVTIGSRNDDVILDFFAGSATTAHAVMQLNAEDGGNRKYILCTLDEQVADKSAAKEAGYETIDQISRERIRRAAKKIQEEHPETVGKQDFGFRAYKLDSSNFKEVSQTPDSFSQESLFDSVSNIKDGRTDLDLLFQIMLTWGMELSLPITKTQIDGTDIYNVADGALIACFADEISESVLRKIAKEEPLRAVFKDESFANSAAKINLGQIFKEVAPNTKVKVV